MVAAKKEEYDGTKKVENLALPERERWNRLLCTDLYYEMRSKSHTERNLKEEKLHIHTEKEQLPDNKIACGNIFHNTNKEEYT